jgi:hypothetical protein
VPFLAKYQVLIVVEEIFASVLLLLQFYFGICFVISHNFFLKLHIINSSAQVFQESYDTPIFVTHISQTLQGHRVYRYSSVLMIFFTVSH